MAKMKIIRGSRLIVALAALCALTPASAEVVDLDGWKLDGEDGSCLLTGEFNGGTTLQFYSRQNDAVLVTLQNPAWRSITHKRMYDLEVEFDALGAWKIRAMGWAEPGEVDRAVVFTRRDIGADGGDLFIKEFAVAGSMRIAIASRRIDRLSMKGSLKAAAAFLSCVSGLPAEADPEEGENAGEEI